MMLIDQELCLVTLPRDQERQIIQNLMLLLLAVFSTVEPMRAYLAIMCVVQDVL